MTKPKISRPYGILRCLDSAQPLRETCPAAEAHSVCHDSLLTVLQPVHFFAPSVVEGSILRRSCMTRKPPSRRSPSVVTQCLAWRVTPAAVLLRGLPVPPPPAAAVGPEAIKTCPHTAAPPSGSAAGPMPAAATGMQQGCPSPPVPRGAGPPPVRRVLQPDLVRQEAIQALRRRLPLHARLLHALCQGHGLRQRPQR
jgi:hypothetical protein